MSSQIESGTILRQRKSPPPPSLSVADILLLSPRRECTDAIAGGNEGGRRESVRVPAVQLGFNQSNASPSFTNKICIFMCWEKTAHTRHGNFFTARQHPLYSYLPELVSRESSNNGNDSAAGLPLYLLFHLKVSSQNSMHALFAARTHTQKGTHKWRRRKAFLAEGRRERRGRERRGEGEKSPKIKSSLSLCRHKTNATTPPPKRASQPPQQQQHKQQQQTHAARPIVAECLPLSLHSVYKIINNNTVVVVASGCDNNNCSSPATAYYDCVLRSLPPSLLLCPCILLQLLKRPRQPRGLSLRFSK